MDRQQLLKRLDKAWMDFRESYASLSDSELMEPDVTGTWSMRDIIAHVTCSGLAVRAASFIAMVAGRVSRESAT
ncbi:MAG: hypothetical protein ACREOO_08055 [bacterium]